MTAPKLTWAMIKHLDWNANCDPHLQVKLINQVIEEKAAADEGKCPHRPASLMVQISGDFASKASGSFCVYCSEEIEIERVVWRAKSKLPTAPMSA